MPIVSIDVLGSPNEHLAIRFSQAVHATAVEFLHAEAELLTVRVSFAQTSDKWFFNLEPLAPTISPAFYLLAPIGRGIASDIEVAQFTVETRNRLRMILVEEYPGTSAPNYPDRNKVVVVEMP